MDPGARLQQPPALPRWLLVCAALLLCWVYVHGMATQPLKWEEPRRCLVAMEMIHSGDYIAPTLLGEPYRSKPPLQNWLIVLLAGNRFERVGAVPLRLVTLIALALTALGVWRAGISGVVPGPDARPALVWLTFGIVVQFGRSGELDIVFTACVAGALVVFEIGRRRGSPWLQWFAPQLLVGLGVLTKWIAPLLFYPPVLWLAWRRRDRVHFSRAPFVTGLAAMLAIVAAWLIPLFAEEGGAQLGSKLISETGRKTVEGGHSWIGHLSDYPLAVLGVALPWVLVVLFVAREGWPVVRGRVRQDPWLSLGFTAAAWTAIVFLFVPGMRERYLMPATPAIALLVVVLAEHVRSHRPRPAIRWVAWAFIGLIWIAALATQGPRNAPGAWWIWPAIAGGVVLCATALALRDRRRPASAALLLQLALLYGVHYAGVHEFRKVNRNTVYGEIARALEPGLDDRPVILEVPDLKERKLAFAVGHLLGRPVLKNPPEGGPYQWIGMIGTKPPAGSTRVLLAGDYELRHVPDGPAAGRP